MKLLNKKHISFFLEKLLGGLVNCISAVGRSFSADKSILSSEVVLVSESPLLEVLLVSN